MGRKGGGGGGHEEEERGNAIVLVHNIFVSDFSQFGEDQEWHAEGQHLSPTFFRLYVVVKCTTHTHVEIGISEWMVVGG